MERAYQTYLNLVAKVRKLASHRALKHDPTGQATETFNRFLVRMSQEIASCKVVPGSTTVAGEPSLKEFVSSE